MPPRGATLEREARLDLTDQELTDLPSLDEAAVDPLIPVDGNWTKRTMKRFLDAQPKRMVIVQRDPGDKPGVDSFEVVRYQGFNYPIRKGRSVEVPEPIAQILDQAEEPLRTMQARNRAALLHDVGDGTGPEIHVDRGGASL